MRIRYGKQSGSSFGGKAAQRDRASAFRNKHRVGQRLRGILVRWVKSGLAWVRVDGQELVAELHSTPEVGATLFFLVDRLEPQIVLREIHEGDSFVLPTDPQYLLRYYREKRDQLDSLLHDKLWDESASLAPQEERLKVFCQFVAEHAEACCVFVDMTRALQAINHLLDQRAKGRVYYQPWLIPQAGGVELHVQDEGITLGACFEDGSNCLVRFILAHAGDIACRVYTDNPAFAAAVTAQCRVVEGEESQCLLLGVSPLPDGVYDILGPLLTDTTHLGGGLNVRA